MKNSILPHFFSNFLIALVLFFSLSSVLQADYTYTFTNYCSEPIWVAQSADISNQHSYPPKDGNWALAPYCTENGQCGSGQSCHNHVCSCKQDSDCPGSASCNIKKGKTSGSCNTSISFDIPRKWNSGTFWPRTGCNVPVGDKTALNCQTGQCTASGKTNGLLDCGVGITSPTNPTTQFEVTSTASTINYDVSNVAGFNVETTVTAVGGSYIVPGTTTPTSCNFAGCLKNLNKSCPSNLQLINHTGDVIGCLDPCTQCQRSAKDSTAYKALKCDKKINKDSMGNTPVTTVACDGSDAGLPTYQDMYCAQNMNDTTTNTQASSNQGTPTAFSQDDCLPETTFTQPEYRKTPAYIPPTGMGVCLYQQSNAGTQGLNNYGWYDQKSKKTLNCKTETDGTPCGGYLTGPSYSDALGYTCQTVSYKDAAKNKQTAHLCLPPTISGLGTCTKDSNGNNPLYTGVGGVMNASWVEAAIQAGDNKKPYYENFKAACDHAYAWQYDDAASGFACNTTPISGGKTLSGFDIGFCVRPIPLK